MAYESRCEELQRELLQLTSVKQKVETEYSTLKKTVQKKEQEEERRKSMLEVRSSPRLTPRSVSSIVRDQ